MPKDEKYLNNLYNIKTQPCILKSEMDMLLKTYWKNVIEAVKSGCFTFIAHPDYCCQFNLATEKEWDSYKQEFIEALQKTKTPCEINTKSIRTTGNPSPSWNMIEEMIKKELSKMTKKEKRGF